MSKFQFQMTQQNLLGIWVIGIYLRFGAWDLVVHIFFLFYHRRLSIKGDPNIPLGRK